MDIKLTFHGVLPACQGENKHTAEKHAIRMRFSRQLERKFAEMPTLIEWSQNISMAPTFLKAGRVVWADDDQKHRCCFYIVDVCGFKATPLVCSHNGLACHLDVEILRREKRGGVLASGGDLDNRLKCLLDSLSLPLQENQVPGSLWGKADERMYCLLEDDALVSRLKVDVERWDEEPVKPEEADHVFVRVNAHIEPFEPRVYHPGF